MPADGTDRISGTRQELGLGTLLSGIAAILIITLVSIAFEHEATQRHLERQRREVIGALGAMRSALEGALWRDTAIVHGIVVRISERPGLDQEEFASFVAPMLKGYDTIKYVAAARDLVISHVWPEEVYDRIIGLDYRTLPDQYPAVREVMDQRLPLLVGPISLRQGGKGVILRAPVPNRADRDGPEAGGWGVLSAVLDYDRMLAEAGVTDRDGPYEILIIGSDGASGAAIPLHGDLELLNRDPIVLPLGFPGNQWRIAAIPKGGWKTHADIGPMPRLLAGLSILAVLAGCWLKLNSERSANFWKSSIRRSELRFRSLFENASDGILIVDPASGRIRDANNLAARLLQRHKRELYDSFLSDLIAKRRSESSAEAILAIQDLESHILRMSFAIDDGTFDAEVSVRRLLDEGEPLLLIHIRDIGARREHEEALMRARIEAENANALKSRFLANFSHEIRTPLNAIVGFSEIMKDGLFGPVEPPRYAAYVEDIHKSGRHLLSMLNDILDLSRIEAGEMPIECRFEPLGPLVDDSIAMIAPLAGSSRVVLERGPSLSEHEIACDAVRLRQMLINLLSNAVKFTLPDGRVVIDLAREEDGAALIIRDTGIGMSEHEIEDAMRPFGQVASHKTAKHVGSGLGLTLTRALAELQGFSFRINSEPNKGTTVIIAIPENAIRPLRQVDMFRTGAR
ncbi:MAG: hypothetical protein Kow00104_05410 [Rhodothalassiaceae bacterium]